jgi:hypothetical protein
MIPRKLENRGDHNFMLIIPRKLENRGKIVKTTISPQLRVSGYGLTMVSHFLAQVTKRKTNVVICRLLWCTAIEPKMHYDTMSKATFFIVHTISPTHFVS